MLQNDSIFGVPLIFIGLGAIVPAAIFLFVWPRSAAKQYKLISWPHYILHYFQSLAWILLGLAAVVFTRSPLVSAVLALLGILVYGVFIGKLVQARRLPQS